MEAQEFAHTRGTGKRAVQPDRRFVVGVSRIADAVSGAGAAKLGASG